MPVFTAAVLAVTAAIELGTVAAAATAAVAVSAAIGVAGIGVTAVGAITGNKGLLQAGKIMGYVGLGGGLAGGALGGLGAMAEGGSFLQGAADSFSGAASLTKDAASSYVDNISNFFNPETASSVMGAQQEAMGTGIVAATNPQAGQAMLTGGMDQAALGKGISAGTSGALAPESTGALSAGAADQTASAAQSLADNAGSPMTPGPQAPSPVNAPAPVSAPAAPAAPGNALPGTDPFAVNSPVAGAPSGASMGPMDSLKQLLPGGGTPTTGKGLFDSMPDWMKMSLMTTGAQGLTGAAAGYYQGLNQQEQLNFQKLVNSQYQNQVQYLNKNNAYAPLVKFGTQPNPTTGLINRPGA